MSRRGILGPSPGRRDQVADLRYTARMRALIVAVALLSAAAATAASAFPPAATPVSAPPKLRLGEVARPLRYAAELTIDPARDTFTGRLTIELTAREALTVLWLNANDLTISRATAEVGSVRIAARPLPQPKDFVGLAFEQPLPAGPARVIIDYTGKLATKESSGASRQKEGNDFYVFTHFEPIDARRVFPCFDEPSFKVPWQVSLIVPAMDRAFANTPELARKDIGGGMARVDFAETKPLPSYLVAFAVGPFETVPAGRTRTGAPIRIITPHGQLAQARWAAEVTAPILAALEDYLGSPYPYEKVDHIAVPFFGGAMENPGLITFASALMLRRSAEEAIPWRRRYAEVAIHELAHQWFGDLVTHAWWDDIWLNEAFATWVTPKIIATWQPTWRAAEERVLTASGAMGQDSLVSARQIRQPITGNDDISNAFDSITYRKGASVLHMFEQSIGAETFRRGVQRYLKQHAHGNATTANFLSAVSSELGRDIAPAFSTFLDQPGVPMVSVELVCNHRRGTVKLRQQRYVPAGSPGVEGNPTWKIPVCVRHDQGRACTLLESSEGEIALATCPSWLAPNEGAAGYYRTNLAPRLLGKLLADGGKKLTAPERLGAIGDVNALARAGILPYDQALAFVPKLAVDPSRHVVEAAAGMVGWLRDADLVPDKVAPNFSQFIRARWGNRAHALGWTPKPGEDEDTRILRGKLLPLVADEGDDLALAGEARALAARWIVDKGSVDPDMLESVLGVAAARGDQQLFDAWHAAAAGERDLTARRRLLGAMGMFRDPAIVQQALDLMLEVSFDIRESMTLLSGANRTPTTRPLAWAFVQEHFDNLVEKLPREWGSKLPFVATSQCDPMVAVEVAAFFKERTSRFVGGPRNLAQALELMRLCATFKQTQAPNVERFFARYPRGVPARAQPPK